MSFYRRIRFGDNALVIKVRIRRRPKFCIWVEAA